MYHGNINPSALLAVAPVQASHHLFSSLRIGTPFVLSPKVPATITEQLIRTSAKYFA